MRLVVGAAFILAVAAPTLAHACAIHRGQPPAGPIVALASVANSTELIAVAEGIVVRSSDAGLSWEVLTELTAEDGEEPGPASIAAAGARVAIARGSHLLLSVDGGRGFLELELPLSEPARAIAFVDGGAELLVAHGGSIARLEVGEAGVHLVGDGHGPGEVDGLAAGPTGVFAIIDGEILRSDDGGRSFREAALGLRALAADPPRALAVDEGGDLWIASASGVRVWGVDGDEARWVEVGPGLGEPSAIAPGLGDALYVVDGGELAEIRLDCAGEGAVPPPPALAVPRRTGRRVVRGLLPRVSFDLRAGYGRLGVVLELSWPMLPPDHRESDAWAAAGDDDAAEDRRLLGLRVTAWDAWAADRAALAAPAVAATPELLGRAVRALEARAQMELLEADWP